MRGTAHTITRCSARENTGTAAGLYTQSLAKTPSHWCSATLAGRSPASLRQGCGRGGWVTRRLSSKQQRRALPKGHLRPLAPLVRSDAHGAAARRHRLCVCLCVPRQEVQSSWDVGERHAAPPGHGCGEADNPRSGAKLKPLRPGTQREAFDVWRCRRAVPRDLSRILR